MSQKFSQNIDLRQSQNLVMTPQLQQAIKILQLSNLELGEFIEEEMERNPLLEKDENSSNSDQKEQESTSEKDSMDETFEQAFEPSSSTSDFDAGSSSIGSGGSSKFEDPEYSLENRLSSETTLREHLQEQLFISFNEPRDRIIGAMLIDQLDESGYLRRSPAELSEQLGCSLERIEKLLTILKGFDPTGVFASGLSECIALQLDEKGTLDEPMQTLLAHLDMIANYEHKKLADICGVNETYLSDMIAEIRECNPKPASEFDHLVVQTAIPDVLMKRRAKNLGGGWRVELNSETLPRVLVNQEYYAEIKEASGKDKASKEYITSQMNNASFLVKAMDQRAKTILKVASEIIEEQDAFFNYGIEFLRPMKLSDIAEKIDMHESTVSRVTTNKYIGTPRGIFELKFFFTTALGGGDPGSVAHSAKAVKARIKSLVDAEDPKKILSDDKLVELLKAESIDIARRTVAKYREAMNIGSSVQRRKQKRML